MKAKIQRIMKGENRNICFLALFTSIISILMFFSYSYVDLKSLTVWTLNLLDCIWDGNLYGYYAYSAENIYHLTHEYMGSNYMVLIPWAIWNIPIWIMQRWFGIAAIGHAWTLLYSKLFLAAVWIVTLFYSSRAVKMIEEGNEGKRMKTLYLMFSCPMAMIAVYYAGQSDIVSICLFVIAFCQLLQGKKRYFYLLSALAIGAKPYVLLAYLAIVLLMEKNIWRICLRCLEGSSLILLFHVIYSNAPLYSESMHRGPSSAQMESLLGNILGNPAGGGISLFLLLLIVFYFIMYMHPWGKGEKKTLVYAAAVPFLLYFAFSECEFYRLVYLVPFIYFLLFINEGQEAMSLLLETIVHAGVMIKWYCMYVGFFSNEALFQFVRSLHPGFLKILDPIREVKQEIFLNDAPVFIMISTVVSAALVLLAVMNLPEVKERLGKENSLQERQILWIRAAMPLMLVLLSYYGR